MDSRTSTTKENLPMVATRALTIAAGIAFTVVAGAACGSAKPAASVRSVPTVASPSTTITAPSSPSTAAGVTSPSPTSASPATPATPRAQAAQPAPTTTTTNAPRLTPEQAAALVLGINDQIQQAESTPNGPKALTPAEAQAIIDAQSKALGLPTKP
jgi:hypothetical protein